MSLEDYPEDVEIVETNFKTDQQSEAAEKIAAEWPVDLDRLAEEGQHVKMFYKQVLEQFLGPESEDATFAEIKDEYGDLEQWAENGDAESTAEDVEVPDVDDIEPGTDEAEGADPATADESADAPTPPGAPEPSGSDDGQPSPSEIGASLAAESTSSGDVDANRRAWFRAGFREGVEFALENPDLFESS